MTDPIALAALPNAAASVAPSAPTQPPLDPGETRVFAHLMMGGGALPGGAAAGGGNPIGDAAMAYAAQLSGNHRSIEDLRSGMLAAYDPSDPVKTMFAMTDLSMQAQTTFAKLHISTGLASAATSLFGTLLKNQQ